jgi:uncharacterized membrane protein
MRNNSGLENLTKANIDLIAKIEEANRLRRTTGERVADVVTSWIGSWPFLIIQSLLLFAWMIVNLVGWWRHWDPYPFILLNLVLSFQAAYATPVIMMSQNRQARIDDRRNRLDLQINLLAEQENTEQLHLLRLICEKLDIQLPKKSGLEQITRPDKILQQIESAAEILKQTTSATKEPEHQEKNSGSPGRR